MELTPEKIEYLKKLETKEEIVECCRKLEKQLSRTITEPEIFAITYGFHYGFNYSQKKLSDFILNYLENSD